ncbi:hypothetical protein Mfla_2398 [Methylobacillus flagellatus KT]|uniref:PEP-CTERM protein-sorting domain-containing protein n=2 Tax=Methylobacillus flagellatus TaxID=405 RepID=Q1GYM4_METFK|nr:hypothetical protein Mfla_2398 [Methylobacillus flagellatus KT]
MLEQHVIQANDRDSTMKNSMISAAIALVLLPAVSDAANPTRIQDAGQSSETLVFEHLADTPSVPDVMHIDQPSDDAMATASHDGATPENVVDASPIDAHAAAVPEPSAYALLLAGFILMGFISHRRRRDKFKV